MTMYMVEMETILYTVDLIPVIIVTVKEIQAFFLVIAVIVPQERTTVKLQERVRRLYKC